MALGAMTAVGRTGPPKVGRWAGVAAVAGGVTWIIVRPIVANTWDAPIFGLTYTDANRLMVVPLLLMLVASMSVHRSPLGRIGRVGVIVLAGGLLASLAGVVVEFVIGSGLRGTRDLAMLGWGVYLLGLLGQVIGVLSLAFATARARLAWLALVAFAIAALHLTWLPLIATGNDAAAIADQVLIGAAWVVLGVLLLSLPVVDAVVGHEVDPR